MSHALRVVDSNGDEILLAGASDGSLNVRLSDSGSGATTQVLNNGADALSNATNQLVTAALLYAYDSTAGDWNRVATTTLGASLTIGNGFIPTASVLYAWDDADSYDRLALESASNPNLRVGVYYQGQQVQISSTSGGDALSDSTNHIHSRAAMGGYNGSTWDRIRSGIGNPGTGVLRTDSATIPNADVSQVTVNNTTTQILASNTNRSRALIKNYSGEALFIVVGASATTSGYPLAVGEEVEIRSTEVINGIVATTSTDVRVIEETKA